MEDILTQLKKEMMSPQNRKLSQPPEGLLILFLVMDSNSVFLLPTSRSLAEEKRKDYLCRIHAIHFLSPGAAL